MIKLDPRTKLYLLVLSNLLLLFHVSLLCEVIFTSLILVLIICSKKYKTGIRLAIFYYVLVLLEVVVVPNVGKGVLANLISLVAIGVRMILPCIYTGLYAFSTTSVSELVCAMRKMHIPETIIIPCMVVIRFFPTVKEDYQNIKNAMALRGIDCSLAHPFTSLEYMIIPLLMNSNNVTEDLSIAAITKGIGMQNKHTSRKEIHFSLNDFALLCISIIILGVNRI